MKATLLGMGAFVGTLVIGMHITGIEPSPGEAVLIVVCCAIYDLVSEHYDA